MVAYRCNIHIFDCQNNCVQQHKIPQRPRARPIPKRRALAAPPLVQRHPDRLLGREVRVPRPRPESGGVEAAVELGARVTRRAGRLRGGVVVRFGLVVGPLLLVGEELEDDEAEDEFWEDGVVGREGVAAEAGGEEEDVGGCCDEEEEELCISATSKRRLARTCNIEDR
jgi:hypothetical protein